MKERELESLNDQKDSIAQQQAEQRQKKKELQEARDGIIKSKQGHLGELLDTDLRNLKLTYVVQVDKKERYERELDRMMV